MCESLSLCMLLIYIYAMSVYVINWEHCTIFLTCLAWLNSFHSVQWKHLCHIAHSGRLLSWIWDIGAVKKFILLLLFFILILYFLRCKQPWLAWLGFLGKCPLKRYKCMYVCVCVIVWNGRSQWKVRVRHWRLMKCWWKTAVSIASLQVTWPVMLARHVMSTSLAHRHGNQLML